STTNEIHTVNPSHDYKTCQTADISKSTLVSATKFVHENCPHDIISTKLSEERGNDTKRISSAGGQYAFGG
ncbi:MAG: hypothetical protein IKP64_10990, partial [Selenomonadaceae bacterium]|nr:hypothetical protein [Selenomonadaceae bacterium]